MADKLNYTVVWKGTQALLDGIQYVWQELVRTINQIIDEVDGGTP